MQFIKTVLTFFLVFFVTLAVRSQYNEQYAIGKTNGILLTGNLAPTPPMGFQYLEYIPDENK